MRMDRRSARLGALVVVALLPACAGDDPVAPDRPPVGTVVVSNRTTGGGFDVDGFEVWIDQDRWVRTGLNHSVVVSGVRDGAHTVRLDGVAENCVVLLGPDRPVTLTGGSSARVDFEVACLPPQDLGDLRVLLVRRAALSSGATFVVLTAADGARIAVTPDVLPISLPDISPDGRRILFAGDPQTAQGPGIYVMGADGGPATRLLGGGTDPRWSPDGTEIVYLTGTGWWGGSVAIMRADGSGSAPITGQDVGAEDASPRWSPDGSRIAFTRNEAPLLMGNHLSVWVVDRDGSNAARLTEPFGGAFPAWWSGGRIAYLALSGGTTGSRGIWSMNEDGSDGRSVLESGRSMLPEDWTPEGDFLLITMDNGFTGTDAFLLHVEDGRLIRLTAGDASYAGAAFWPAGGS